MSLNEMFRKLKGKGGSDVVDEGYSAASKESYLDYTGYNEDGDLVVYFDFPRNTIPKDISQSLNDQANDILANPPEGMPFNEVLRIVDDLKKRANNVPGLKK